MAQYQTVRGTRSDDYYRGGDLAERILGRRGDDDLSGGAGDDIVNGGAGNDLLEGGRGNDILRGGEGIDAVNYGGAVGEVDVNLANGTAREFIGSVVETDKLFSIEVVIGSTFDDSIRGSDRGDDLRGGDGNDYIAGGAGDDIIRGDRGSDVIDGSSGFDYVDYFYVDTGIVVTLDSPMSRDGLGGADDIRGVEGVLGSRQDDTITGSQIDNRLTGEAGDDVLSGLGGNDELVGGLGADVLSGGAGADQFTFTPFDVGNTPTTTDRITDFSQAEGDKIDIHAIDADWTTPQHEAFTFIGTAAFSGTAGELRYEVVGGQTIVSGDVDGDGASDGMLVLDGVHALTAADFVL